MHSFIELNKNHLINNYYSIRKYINPDTKIVSVLKANAYGHGLKEVAKILDDHTDYFQVDDISELMELRKVSNKPCFVFGYIANSELITLTNFCAILGATSINQLKVLDKVAGTEGKVVEVHICVDSALGRDGFLLNELEELMSVYSRLNNVKITGLYSHFANIEDTRDFSHAQKQIELYYKAVSFIESKLGYKVQKHISSTAGALVFEKDQGASSLIRLGIGLYGLWPSEYLEQDFKGQIELKPVLRWVSEIAQIKTLLAGSTVGYGLTFTTDRETKIAIIPQGYSDGYDRKLSSIGEVLIHGIRCRVLGRISMNMMVVDITHIFPSPGKVAEGPKGFGNTYSNDPQIGDEVVLIGDQGNETITAEELAEKIGSINYEIVARINPLLHRNVY